MNAIISNGDYTASVQLPVERKQLAGALSYLSKNHASAYDIKYNEESDQGLSFTLDCRGVVENSIAKAIPTGFRFHTFNDTIALMHNLPYQSKREFENTVKVEGLASYEQLDRMLTEAYPQSVTTKYYCPLPRFSNSFTTSSLRFMTQTVSMVSLASSKYLLSSNPCRPVTTILHLYPLIWTPPENIGVRAL